MNLRVTKQRQIVYEEVLSRCDHPTADQIYFAIHQKHPNISKSTVYRNLDILSKEEKIKRIKIPGSDRFDLTLCEHSHIVCTCCGKVVDAHPRLKDIDVKVEDETGFKIKGHSLVFEGLCPDCQNKL